MQRIEALEGFHPLHQPFGVVEPVDADHHVALAEALHHVLHEGRANGAAGAALELLDVEADGKGADAGLPRPATEHELIVGGLEGLPVWATMLGDEMADEIADIGLGLEADEIVLQEQGQEALVVWQHGHHLGRGEGDMQEKADAVGAAPAAQLFGDRNEMVVMHPDYIVGADELHQLGGEVVVDAEIAGEVAPGKLSEVDAIVQDRP